MKHKQDYGGLERLRLLFQLTMQFVRHDQNMLMDDGFTSSL